VSDSSAITPAAALAGGFVRFLGGIIVEISVCFKIHTMLQHHRLATTQSE
jgi:hypothetical protein